MSKTFRNVDDFGRPRNAPKAKNRGGSKNNREFLIDYDEEVADLHEIEMLVRSEKFGT